MHSGDTSPCRMTGATSHSQVVPVILHGVVNSKAEDRKFAHRTCLGAPQVDSRGKPEVDIRPRGGPARLHLEKAVEHARLAPKGVEVRRHLPLAHERIFTQRMTSD